MGGKINRAVAFEEVLSLQPHMSETDEGAMYSLYSVVVHDGFSGARLEPLGLVTLELTNSHAQ